jgi:endonuclease G
LESYCRDLVHQGKELYIVAGGSGSKETIAGARVNVPADCWKVALVLPEGDNDLRRIGPDTRVLAVSMPNTIGIANDPWRKYLTTVRAIERATGYDLFSRVPKQIQDVLETRMDSGRAPASRTTVRSGAPAGNQAPDPGTLVWVNTRSGIYWRPGTRYYGKTKEGKYMSEEEAIRAGYTAAKR